MGLAAEQGALVRSVEAGAPADKAGIQPGDIITRVNGKTIGRTSDLPRMIGAINPGSQAVLTLLRNGKSMDVPVTVARAEEEGRVQSLQQQEGGATPRALAGSLGLEVTELTASQRSQLGIKNGVLVRGVVSGSSAEQAGLQAGDVILSLGNQLVDSVAALNAAIGKMPAGRPTTVLVLRDGMAQYGMIRPR